MLGRQLSLEIFHPVESAVAVMANAGFSSYPLQPLRLAGLGY